MELRTNNLDSYLFEEFDKSETSILVISPFISLLTTERLLNVPNFEHLECTFVTRFDRKLFINGGSSIEALKLLKENGVKILALKNLHSKVYMIDNQICIIGSANFTKKGLNENKELLMFLYESYEIEPVVNYVNTLLTEIESSGNWYVDEKMIDIEIEMKNHLKPLDEQDSTLNYSWGAELQNNKAIDEDDIVLSVSVGGTFDIVEKYAIHAHPISYNYRAENPKYITFRYPNGGQMKRLYEIVKTLEFNISDYEEVIKKSDFPQAIKSRLESYIVERLKGFKYEKTDPYKYYILKETLELPNCPRPQKNNTGGWFYRAGDLINAKNYVQTITKQKSQS